MIALLYEFCQFKTYGKGKTGGKKTIEEKMQMFHFWGEAVLYSFFT